MDSFKALWWHMFQSTTVLIMTYHMHTAIQLAFEKNKTIKKPNKKTIISLTIYIILCTFHLQSFKKLQNNSFL